MTSFQTGGSFTIANPNNEVQRLMRCTRGEVVKVRHLDDRDHATPAKPDRLSPDGA